MTEELLPKPQTDLPLPEKELPEHATEPTHEQVIVKNETHEEHDHHGKPPILKILLLGVLVALTLAAIAGAYVMGQNSVYKELNPTAPAIPPADPDIYEPTPTPDLTTDWKTFNSTNLGFSIKYPNSTSTTPGEWKAIEKANMAGFGPVGRGDYTWGIDVASSKTLDQLISAVGEQFNDKKESRNSININGSPATISTVTTAQIPTWISKTIYIENEGKIYVISNGAVEDPEFENFYKSFKFN